MTLSYIICNRLAKDNNKLRQFYPNNKKQPQENMMEMNASETYFTFRNLSMEEDPSVLAKSYMMYKIGEFNKLVVKTKIVLEWF